DGLDLLDDLLAAFPDTASLAETFERMSEMVRPVIAHDAVALPVLQPGGAPARQHASPGIDDAVLSELVSVPDSRVRSDAWKYDLVGDTSLAEETFGRAGAAGFRSMLRVPIRLDGRLAAVLAFMAREPNVYGQPDGVAARRIAEHLAM